MAISQSKRVTVVGGGLAGLSCTIKLAEEGVPVDLFSMVPVKRSHSVCAQGGINACNDIARQQGYSEWMHFDETVLGGDFLADQPPVLEMANWAPRIIDLDLILYNDEVIDTPALQVPHPRMKERAFVTVPLADLGVEVEAALKIGDGSNVTRME